MTIEEFYKWSKENDCAEYEIMVECFDGYADELNAYIEKYMLEKRSYDVVMKCRHF